MPGFGAPAVTTDPLALQAEAKGFLEEELPGWHSSPGSIEDLVIDAYSYAASEQAEALRAELVAAFRSLGSLVGVEPIRPQPAIGEATLTLTDNAGHVLLASGTILGLRTSANELQTFRLVTDLIVPSGSTTGVGLVEATEAGSTGNNLGGAAELISADAVVLSASVATTGGGVDEEDEQTFLDRLTEELAIQKPGPVLARDAAVVARSIAGVYRATAVDNLKPSAADGGEGVEETGVERCVTVSCVDATGAPCSAEVMAAVDALLQSLRELNFKFFVVRPHYASVDVACTVYAWPGANLAQVKAEVAAALEGVLSPRQWSPEQGGRTETWKNDTTVRQSTLFAAIQNVQGVRFCSSLSFAKSGSPLGTANVSLSSSAVPALPEPGAINVTVEPSE